MNKEQVEVPEGSFVFHGAASRWGPGKFHLAIHQPGIGWTAACRTYPGEWAPDARWVTCKACIRLLEDGY